MLQHIETDLFNDRIAPRLRARGLIPVDASWAALRGGRTNWIWRVTGCKADIVVKLFSGGQSNPLFPNDPSQEVLALRHLADHDIAPCLVDQARIGSDDCLIYDYLPGDPWMSDTGSAAKLLHRLHRIAPPEGLRTLADGSRALKQQTLEILSACPDTCGRTLLAQEPAGKITASGRSCFLHGDPVPANMIRQGNKIQLIDWQCPATGDPCEDLSIFLSPAMQLTYRGAELTAQEISDFLAAYADKETVGRYLKLAPWYHWRMAAYCLWQECRGDPGAARAGAAELEALRAALAV